MVPGLLPLILWLIPRQGYEFLYHHTPAIGLSLMHALFPTLDQIPLVRVFGVFSFTFVLGCAAICRQQTIRRPGESSLFPSVLGYTGSVMATLWLFPAHLGLALAVLAIVALGDGSATLGGLLIGGPKLAWNSAKSYAGSLCFLICATPLAALYIGLESPPSSPWSNAIFCGFIATGTAALVESLPSRINDNLRVGMTAAVTAVVMQTLQIGW